MGLDMRHEYRDVSSTTSFSVNASRSVSPIGALVHTTAGGNSLAWLQGGSARKGSPSSADYLIGRAGQCWRITPIGRYAYHAGRSVLNAAGRHTNDMVSQLLVGIELEQEGEQEVTFEQVDTLGLLIVSVGLEWSWRWPYIIYGHYAVARPLGRRSDPVNLDWGALMGRVYVYASAAHVGGL